MGGRRWSVRVVVKWSLFSTGICGLPRLSLALTISLRFYEHCPCGMDYYKISNHPSIHQSINFLTTCPIEGWRGAGTYPSCHGARCLDRSPVCHGANSETQTIIPARIQKENIQTAQENPSRLVDSYPGPSFSFATISRLSVIYLTLQWLTCVTCTWKITSWKQGEDMNPASGSHN